MVQAGYTTDRLLQIGRSNYDRLCLFCENLERSGLWEQARQVMKQSAKMILDRYVQSVLVTFAAAEGIVTESEREYIAIITDSNLLAVSPEIPVNGELIEECRRFCVDIKYPVFEGAGSVQLNEGIGHMTNTTELCGKGNCVLAGHNGSRRGVYFTYLCNIEARAKVVLMNRKKEKHEYTVKEMKVVNPYDEWVTEQTEGESLTLFTCAEHGTKRFVVKCEPVGNTDQQNGEKTDRREGGVYR